jgi:hypothetical protein
MTRLLATLGVTIACLLSGGCEWPPRQAAQATDVPAATPNPCVPVKVSTLIDRTGSMQHARLPDVTVDDLETAINVLAGCGGELSVGLIHDRSKAGFARLRLDPAPRQPVEPVWAANPFARRRQRAQLARITERYGQEAEAWEAAMQLRVDAFATQVRELLQVPADARRSPVWDGIQRADALLAEPDVEWPSARLWLVAVTDGLDTARGRPLVLRSRATVLVVNGLGTTHALAVLKPALFQSFEAAARFIADTEASTNASSQRDPEDGTEARDEPRS